LPVLAIVITLTLAEISQGAS